jgi:aminopeptidase N
MKSLFAMTSLVAGLAVHGAIAATRIVLPANVVPSHYDIAIRTDAARLRFTGSVKIDIVVSRPARTITLNAADLSFRRAVLSDVRGEPEISYDKAEETATLTFPAPVASGHHVLTIDYAGRINRQAAGLFALDYAGAKGDRRALFTQFENSDARRFIPCWDEPNRKATFTLTATVPAGLMAISNQPVAMTDSLPGGLKRVVFATSPRMSSYLLFFGLGDFERVSRKVNGVDIGVVLKRGDAAKGQFALDAAAQILPFYENYFGVKYPLPKLDLIAGPGSSQFFGAMENWGAIFYFERALEIDPKLSTEADRRRVYIVIAHEMAHQWFGDLVTMDWWDDLWLNEGFASWMEMKAADRFHPEWNVWLDAVESKEGAMQLDARAGTHPIVTPILDVLQASEAFDGITYSKGQAVIRMLENYTGADAFRAGVRNYIRAHAYGNTVTDDLWREIDKVSPRPITRIAHDFTLQPGVPLISAAADGSNIRLSQGRFAMDDSAKKSLSWHVPVLALAPDARDVWRGVVTAAAPASLPGKAGTVVNEGQAGYFRTLYDATLFTGLIHGFARLPAADQLGLVNDTLALGYSGYEPLGDFLGLANQADPAMAPQVQSAIAASLAAIDDLYRGLPGQARFRVFARNLLAPLFAAVGWDARASDSQNTALLRARLLAALSQFDDPAIVAEARRRFASYLRDPSHIAPDVRHSMLAIVARHADAATWDKLHAMARQATDTLEKRELYELLGTAKDRKLAEKALALALTGEVAITTRPTILRSVSGEFPGLAFDFANGHLGVVNGWLETDSRNRFVPSLAGNAHDPQLAAKVKSFAGAHIPPTARSPAVKAESAIRFNARVRAERLPEVDRWLSAQHIQ